MPDDQRLGEFNPYQAPASLDRGVVQSGPLEDWLAHPSASLSRVRSGIGTIYTGNMLIVASVFSMAGSTVIPPAAIVSLVLSLIGGTMIIIGQLYCLAAPRESGARGIIFASVALFGLSFVAPFAGAFLGGFLIAFLASVVFSVVGYLLFIVFLFQMARIIGRKRLISRSKVVLALASLMAAMVVGFFALAITFPRTEVPWYWYVLFVVGAMLFFGTYLMLLNDLSVMLRVRQVESEPKIIWAAAESQEPSPDAHLPTVE